MVKSTDQQGRYFLRAKDVDHHLVTILASSGKKVDDVMVIVRGNDLKRALTSADEAILEQVETVLNYKGCANLQGQERTAYILLRYDPTYSTFSVADNIPMPAHEWQLTALMFPGYKNLRDIGIEGFDASEEIGEEVGEDAQLEDRAGD
ncbi:hypothetical protein CsSME_00036349 [Camellia sinensis var. sinensis]